jgi:hypothetical protein
MTRDEAIEKLAHTRMYMLGDRRAEAWIEVFEVLGMLKLDEPKCARERAVDAMFGRGHNGVITPRHAIDAIEAAGLKIVEK